MPPQAAPFWLCHECGAQMRPLMIDGVPHCASCNSEFLEILDEDVNPDPHRELPHPPERPGHASDAPPVPPRPGQTDPQHVTPEAPNFFSGLFESVFGGGQPGQENQQPQSGPSSPSTQQPQRSNQPRTWNFNIGNGAATVTFGSFPQGGYGSSPPGTIPFGQPFNPFAGTPVGGYNGAPGDPNDGLDSFFRGFGARPPNRAPQQLEGADLLQALFSIIAEEGGAPGLLPRGRMGDYVMTEDGFNDVLERLMAAAGPQGPLPAPEVVIDGLPRIKFDEKTLEESQYKDCPVCMDDFNVGDEVVRVPCKHVFHPDCIVPWLKTNGSCPVCRFSLVPEPANQSAPQPTPTRAQGTQPGAAEEQTGGGGGGGALATAQGVISNVLNRLFGQSGNEEPPPLPAPGTRPAPPSGSQPAPTGAADAAPPAPPPAAPTGPPTSVPATETTAAAGAEDELNEAMRNFHSSQQEEAEDPSTTTSLRPRRLSNASDASDFADPAADPPEAVLGPDDAADPPEPVLAPDMSSAIPNDYRAMHLRREQEIQQREQERERRERQQAAVREYDPFVDDLD